MRLIGTSQGVLLTWERGATRYWTGFRVSRGFKRFYARRWVIAVRPFSVHFVRYPMTEVEKRARGIAA